MRMLKRIAGINQVLHEIRYFKKIIKKYGEALLPGRYRLFPSMRAIVADDPVSLDLARPYFEKAIAPSKVKKLISWANQVGYYQNKRECVSEQFQAVYSANNYDKVREIKLFSFERREILTICASAHAFERQLLEYESLHPYFAMPFLEKRTQYENSYKIDMVDLIPRPDDEFAVKTIGQCICAYHRAHLAEAGSISARQIAKFSYERQELNDLLTELVEKISVGALALEIPLCFQHGDLSRDNLIYGQCAQKTDFWWIDWEHSGQRLFFYDYFFYILNTAVYFKDKTALEAYLNGDYDDHLKEYFSQFSVQYAPEYRKDYFLLFAVAFLRERVCDKGNLSALKMYNEFICKTIFDEE